LKLRRFEAQVLAEGFGLCIVCSRDDETLLRRIKRNIQTYIMPNGVELASYRSRIPATKEYPEPGPPTLIYLGTMSYYPNIDAILFFWREIAPRILAHMPETRLLVVGHDPAPEVRALAADPRVILTGTVPDVRPYLQQSTAMIVPLRLGGGTRLKILEAMASGLPVISTSVGCQGLEVSDGKDILIADDPQTFAHHTLDLLRNADLRRRLVSEAERVAERYDWGALTRGLIAACCSGVPAARMENDPGRERA
jgi:glycosyltransferase involved in cell wall biosynthesis